MELTTTTSAASNMPVPPSPVTPSTIPTVQPKKRGGAGILIALLVVTLVAAGAFSYYQMTKKPVDTNKTPETTATEGWVVKLHPSLNYVLVDNSGKYLNQLDQDIAGTFDPLTVFQLNDETSGTKNIHYFLTTDKSYIVKTTHDSKMASSNKIEIARNDGKTPQFTILTDTDSEIIDNIGVGTFLYATATKLSTCNPDEGYVCPGEYQLYLKTGDAAPQKVGSKITMAAVSDVFHFSGNKTIFVSYGKKSQVFLVDTAANTIQELTKQLIISNEVVDSFPFVADTQNQKLYYISKLEINAMTIAQYDVATKQMTPIVRISNIQSAADTLPQLALAPSKNTLYFMIPNSSANSLTIQPIDLSTKSVKSGVTVDRMVAMSEFHNGIALVQSGTGFSIDDILRLDMTNELQPTTHKIQLTGISEDIEAAEVLGYWKK